MRPIRVLLCLCFPAFAAIAAEAPPAGIQAVLDAQVAAWNRGDVRAFMDGYDEDTTFVGPEVTHGRSLVLKRYLLRYPDKAAMGTLQFTDLSIRPLGAEYASVIGAWHLSRAKVSGGNTGGRFTLLFHKTAAGWRIILDHTS